MTALKAWAKPGLSLAWYIGSFVCLLAGQAWAEDISIRQGEQKVYEHPLSLKRVAIANPEIVGVTLTSPKTVLLVPKALGATDVSLWDDKSSQPNKVLHINVTQSLALEGQSLEAVDVAELHAESAGAGVALIGEADSLEGHARALEALQKDKKGPVDVSSAAFDNHVQIDIKVVEVSRQNAMRFGFLIGRNGPSSNGFGIVSPPGAFNGLESGENGGVSFVSGSGFLPILNAFNVALGNHGSGLLGTLSVLETNGFAYTLAEPSLSAISGQTATFLAGGEYPVPIRTGGGADSAITIRYKEYGVRLMLTPTILSADRIFLKVAPEVSELDFANAVQTGGVSVPGLKVRRTETSVSLGNGESFVISGMVSRSTVNNIDRMPWLGSLPIIGAFFSSKRFDREDKELLMVVTPRLVRPISRDAALPPMPGQELKDFKPSFGEFFLSRDAYPKRSSTGMSR